MALRRLEATILARWLALALAAALGALAGCDDPGLPRFANPPDLDAGRDGGSDEDGGAN
jgi:hypothetical protein